jgi:hypothetical protein
MFKQVIAIIRESWLPQKLLKQSVLWMYMDYGPSRLVSFRGIELSVHTWLHPATTDHSGLPVIHILVHPQYRYCLSSF